MSKKKIIAIILFIIMGFAMFTFANPSDEITESFDVVIEEDKDVVKDETNEPVIYPVINVIDRYADALMAVEKAENSFDIKDLETARNLVALVENKTQNDQLTERLDIVKESIDAIKLVEDLEKMVLESNNKDDIVDSRDYRKDNDIIDVVDSLRNETVKDDLTARLIVLSRILDDKEAPIFTGIKNNQTTNKEVSLEYEDINLVNEVENKVAVEVTLNGEKIDYLDTFKEEGKYVVTLTDEAYNEETITFIIDTTAPTVVLKDKNNTEVSPNYYNFDLKVVVTDKNIDTIKLNDNDYVSGTILEDTSSYKLVAKDKAGNVTEVEFTIDKVSPTITGVSKNGIYNTNVLPVVNDNILLDTVTLDGNNYANEEIVVEGVHKLVAKDQAGNITEIKFTIDKTAPTLTVDTILNGYSNTKEPKINTSDLSEYTVVVNLNGNEVLNEKGRKVEDLYTNLLNLGTLADGSYEIIATDKATNTSTISFILDRKAPTVTGVENGKFYPSVDVVIEDENLDTISLNDITISNDEFLKIVMNVYGDKKLVVTDKAGNETIVEYTIDNIDPIILLLDKLEVIRGDLIPIKPVIIEENIETIVVKRNGVVIEGYKQGDQLTDHGNYEIIVTDKAGNEDKATFTMDNIKPLFIEPIDGMVYQEVNVKLYEENFDPEKMYLLKQTKTIDGPLGIQIPYYEKVDYTYGNTISEEGAYILVAADQAYNISFARFTIDKSAPILNLENGKHYSGVTFNVEDSHLKGITVTPALTVGSLDVPDITKVKLYENGETLTEDGRYFITAVDAALNESTVLIEIDTEKPIITGVKEGVHYNSVQPSATDKNNVTLTLNGNSYDGSVIDVEGSYTVVAYDEAGNESVPVNFVINKTAISFNVEADKHYKGKVSPIATSVNGNITSLKLNGNDFINGSEISTQGSYTLIVTDIYENTATITFVVDTEKPVIDSSNILTEIGAKNGRTYSVLATVTDTIDGDSKLKPFVVYNDTEELGYLEEIDISKDKVGKYTLTYNTKDLAGNIADTVELSINVMITDYVIVMDNKEVTYNGEAVSVDGIVENDEGIITGSEADITFVITKDGNTVTEIKEAGIYNITATAPTDKYPNIKQQTATYTVNKLDVKVNFTASQTDKNSDNIYQFDGEVKTYKAELVNSNTNQVLTTKEYTTLSSNVGTYSFDASELLNDNYNLLGEATMSVTIEKAELTVTFPDAYTKDTSLVTVTNKDGVDMKDYVVIIPTDKFLIKPASISVTLKDFENIVTPNITGTWVKTY